MVNLLIPTCLCGDFNVLTAAHEKNGGACFRLNWESRHFCDFINSFLLMDIGFKGPPYTWVRGQSTSNRVMKRLDRCLVTMDWLDLFPDPTLLHLIRSTVSDHCPPLLDTEPGQHSPPGLFRFSDIWLHYKESSECCRRRLE